MELIKLGPVYRIKEKFQIGYLTDDLTNYIEDTSNQLAILNLSVTNETEA